MSEQVQTVAREAEPAEPRVELRATVRHSAGGTSPCKSLAGWRCNGWEATVHDISQEGLGLILSRRFEPGVILAVDLPRARETSFHLVLARVVRVAARENGRWLVGCRLVNPLTRDELRALI